MSDRETFGPNENADVIVIGGGVIGLSIARELVLRGVPEVMLIERSRLGAEASSAAGGILAPQVESDHSDEFFRLACASRDMYPEFAAALREETGLDVELDKTGTLYLGLTAQDEEEMRSRYEWQTSEGLCVERLTGDEARRLETSLSENIICALRFPNDFQIESRRLIAALVNANEKLGVRIITGCNVNAIRRVAERVCGVETSAGFVSAATVVVSAGAWSSFIQSVLPPIDIEPVRGQMLCFEAKSQIARYVMYSSRGYLVPRRDGRLLAGSTSEHVGFDKSITEEGISKIKSMAIEVVPALKQIPVVDSWAGFRPRAKDDLPVLGASETVQGLFFATGHYRNGILLAPITGKVIAQAIIDGVMPANLRAFAPNRFSNLIAA